MRVPGSEELDHIPFTFIETQDIHLKPKVVLQRAW